MKQLRKRNVNLGEKLTLNEGLALIDKYARMLESKSIQPNTLRKIVQKVAQDFSLGEFQTYLKQNQKIDCKLIQGLTWHYMDFRSL
jgi:hypothetical protein